MRLPLLAMFLVVAPTALAQSAPAQAGDPVEALARALQLDDDQADLVAELLDPSDPGASWTLAAELLPTLTGPQREILFAPPGSRGAGGERSGAGRRERRDRARRADRQPDPARQAVQRAARHAALGLTDAQAEQIDALEARPRKAGAALQDPEARAQAQAELEAVLTAEQREVVRARQAIQRALRRAMRPGRRGVGGDSE